jgi:hypothetical protein
MVKAINLPPLIVAYVVNTEAAGGFVLLSVWLKLPSAKLIAHVAFAGSPDAGFDGVGFHDDATWQATPYVLAENALSSRPAPLTSVFRDCDGTETPRPLPGGYEIQSAVRLWRFRLKLKAADYTSVSDDGTAVVQTGFGKYVASCTIEPAPESCLTPGEFEALASQCELYLDGPAPNLTP